MDTPPAESKTFFQSFGRWILLVAAGCIMMGVAKGISNSIGGKKEDPYGKEAVERRGRAALMNIAREQSAP